MEELAGGWEAVGFVGRSVYPLLFLGVLAIIIILDRAVAYYRCLRLPPALLELVETYGFAWEDLNRQLNLLTTANAYRQFFGVIVENRHQPAWWLEARAGEEAG